MTTPMTAPSRGHAQTKGTTDDNAKTNDDQADDQADIIRVDDAQTKSHASETNEDYANDIEMNRQVSLWCAVRE